MNTWTWKIALVAAACGGASEPVDLSPDDPSSETLSFPPPTCDQPLESVCGNPNSIVRGQVRVASTINRTRGDLFLALTHSVYDGVLGGGYHIATVLEDVDLSEPVPFAIDMCQGGAMWSEDNCEYGLVAILDTNGDQSALKLLPDDNEPATRVGGLSLSCAAEGPCLDVVLDCKGPDCVKFSDAETCACDDSCSSIASLCAL